MIFKWLKNPSIYYGYIYHCITCNCLFKLRYHESYNKFAVIFNTLSISTNISVNLVDAATGISIGSTSQSVTVNLTFTGPGASKIVSSLDEPITSLSIKNGVGTFGVSSSFTPSAQNPVMVTIQASASGYQTTSYPINIQSTGSSAYTIKMVKLSAPPAGTNTGTTTGQASSSGTTSSQINIQTNTGANTGGSATLTVPTGTTITDANGKPVSGSLIANVTYYSSSYDLSNGSLPTGLSVTAVDSNNNTGPGFIQPAAFASFTVTNQSGQLAKNFSPSITLSFTVPSSTINPTTGNPIQDGETVPIYSFDETNQVWKFETNSTATSFLPFSP